MGKEMKLPTHLGINRKRSRSRMAGKSKEASRGSYLGKPLKGRNWLIVAELCGLDRFYPSL